MALKKRMVVPLGGGTPTQEEIYDDGKPDYADGRPIRLVPIREIEEVIAKAISELMGRPFRCQFTAYEIFPPAKPVHQRTGSSVGMHGCGHEPEGMEHVNGGLFDSRAESERIQYLVKLTKV